jgi:hypothetical protein
MAAVSDNKYDVYNWIIQVIDSCETNQHYYKALRLIDNFHNMYEDWDMLGKLRAHVYFRQHP